MYKVIKKMLQTNPVHALMDGRPTPHSPHVNGGAVFYQKVGDLERVAAYRSVQRCFKRWLRLVYRRLRGETCV